jgi:branched-chain amino acid transport system substrate-binding protein
MWIIGAFAIAGVFAAPAGASAADKQLVIGCALPLSGPLVGFGQPIKQGLDLAVETFNAAHEIPGATIVLDCNDSRGDAKETVNIAGKMVDNPAVLASVSDFTSTATMAAADTYGKGGLVEITPSASHPAITGMNKYMFRASETVPSYIDPIADFITAKLGKKRVAVVQVQTDWGQSVGSTFTAQLKKDGGNVEVEEIYNQGTTDFRAILTKLRREKPDVIFLAMLEEEAATFMRQYKQLGMTDIPVVDSGVGITDRSIKLAQGAMDGVYSLRLFDPESKDPAVQGFVTAFKTKYSKEPDIWNAYGWDAAYLVMNAIKRAMPNPTRESVRDQLAKTGHFRGANGELAIDPETREVIRFGLTPIRVENDKIVYGTAG